MVHSQKVTISQEIDKSAEAIRVASGLYLQSPDWVTFYREIFGLHGVVRSLFPTRKDLKDFEKTEDYQEIIRMLTDLRERSIHVSGLEEPTRVITVRIPKSLHDALRCEAQEHRTSMNKLCISKLLQFIDN